MKNNKIAILIDSCTDVPKEYIEKYGMYVVPLSINYSFGQFQDGVNITAQEVYDNFSKEIPTTSLPTGETIINQFNKIQQDGFKEVIIVTISSGLSGTNNTITQIAKEFPNLDCRIIDTKNIGIGAGLTGILAGQLVAQDLNINEIEKRLNKSVEDTKIFFCVSTLEYLQKGGRIGLVTAVMGTALGIRPIISCNEEGVYYTVKKARGRKKVISEALELALTHGKGHKFNLAIAHGDALEEAREIYEELKGKLHDCKEILFGQISPALVVHTGPGLIGIGIQLVD